METIYLVGAGQLSVRLRGVSPPIVRRLLIVEEASLAQFPGILQIVFNWSDAHRYTFLIRGWRVGDPNRAAQLAREAGPSRPSPRRVRVLNQQLRRDFERWHPARRTAAGGVRLAA